MNNNMHDCVVYAEISGYITHKMSAVAFQFGTSLNCKNRSHNCCACLHNQLKVLKLWVAAGPNAAQLMAVTTNSAARTVTIHIAKAGWQLIAWHGWAVNPASASLDLLPSDWTESSTFMYISHRTS